MVGVSNPRSADHGRDDGGSGSVATHLPCVSWPSPGRTSASLGTTNVLDFARDLWPLAFAVTMLQIAVGRKLARGEIRSFIVDDYSGFVESFSDRLGSVWIVIDNGRQRPISVLSGRRTRLEHLQRRLNRWLQEPTLGPGDVPPCGVAAGSCSASAVFGFDYDAMSCVLTSWVI